MGIIKLKKETNPTISIIIPLYNVAEYAEQTIKSLLPQITREIEIILVDDGSTDNSLEICLDTLNGVENVRYIKQRNNGPSVARNTGIHMSSGEYLLFLDGDDFLLPNAIRNILSLIQAKHPDVLFGRYLRWIPKKGYLKGVNYFFEPPEDHFQRTEYILGKLPESAWNAWRYVCRRNLILDCGFFFEPGVLCEDVEWTLELLIAAESIVFLPKPFYAYNCWRPSSIMNGSAIKKLVDLNYVIGKLVNRYQEHSEICRVLIKQSFLYLSEYCTLRCKERKHLYITYKSVLPLYHLSSSVLHRFIGRIKSPLLLYPLSVLLYGVRLLRRTMLSLKGCSNHVSE